MSTVRTSHRTTGARLLAAGRLLVAAALVTLVVATAGCSPEEPTKKGCAVVDISDSARREIRGLYLEGMDRFVSRIAEQGTGRVCFGYAARGLLGGPAAWATFACDNPEDELRCRPQIRSQVEAAAGQLAAQAANVPEEMHGFSELLEAVALLADNTSPGDEILMLTDGVQKSTDFGNFYSRHLQLDAAGREQLLDRLEQVGLLPDLSGRKLRMPYLLTHTRPRGPDRDMRAVRQQEIKDFWAEYAARTNAEYVSTEGVHGA